MCCSQISVQAPGCQDLTAANFVLSLFVGEERRETAGRCLGELVRKMGERVLRTIIPILAQGMQASKARLCWHTVGHKALTSLL